MNQSQPIPNAICLVEACKRLSIPYTFYDDNHNLIGVTLDREYFFANASTPFNDETISKISKDKEFTYRILKNTIQMPETIGFLDPHCSPEYKSYVIYRTHKEIHKKIESVFSYPVIVKKNSGARGNNVYKCKNKSAVKKALKAIYNKRSSHYDYVAIAQHCVNIAREFRVVVFQGEIVLLYEKDFSQATITDNISPLHQTNSKTILVSDETCIESMSQFIAPLFKKMPIGFVGLDIVIDETGAFWLIELNTKLGFAYFVRDNGAEPLINMYEKMLRFLKKHPQISTSSTLQNEKPQGNQTSQRKSIPHETIQRIRF